MEKAIEAMQYLKQFCFDNLQASDCGDCPFAYGEVKWGEPRHCNLKSSLPPFTWRVGEKEIETETVF